MLDEDDTLEKFRIMYMEASAKIMRVPRSRVNVEYDTIDHETIYMKVYLDGQRVSEDIDCTIAEYVHSLKNKMN